MVPWDIVPYGDAAQKGKLRGKMKREYPKNKKKKEEREKYRPKHTDKDKTIDLIGEKSVHFQILPSDTKFKG